MAHESPRNTSQGVVQRAAINPGTFFGGTRAATNVNANISASNMAGFGVTVNGVTWHTKLVFDPLVTPGPVTVLGTTYAMNPEGSGVTGVIGPDHPYGSQPSSASAAQNNQTAGDIRAMNPHGHVAAHIVNDQLGGPGITQNLFAFPGVANTLMETQVEGNMKAAVEAGNFIYYRAQVHHPASGPADYITMSWNKLDNNGNDIGGGQNNARINYNNTHANTGAVAQNPGTAARKTSLIHPSNPTIVKAQPWGPFQMPDPKNSVALGAVLDNSQFPAVGNKEAFKAYLNNNTSNTLGLQLMLLNLDSTAKYTNIYRWITSSHSGIQIKSRRGITQAMLNDLKSGTRSQKEGALMDILDTGDAPRVIPNIASELYKEAKSSASSRV